MGKITVLEYTNKNPLSLMGIAAGYCWGSNLSDKEKNIKRALECINNGHGRVSEFGDLYITIEGYSARMMRELYTHIGGAPTRLQESTRYVKYDMDSPFVIPPTLEEEQREAYIRTMQIAFTNYNNLLGYGIKKEDAANVLPLGMMSKMVLRINARTLIEMSHQRLCSRAYWEFRNFMHELMKVLSDYSDEWRIIVDNYFVPKCDYLGYCPEKFSCGRCEKKIDN